MNNNFVMRLREYTLLMRLHRPIGILLLLWPTLWGLWTAAEGLPNWLVFIVFVSGVVLMRSAGCVINDYADRNFDARVERTRQRPLVQKRVSSKEALVLFVVLALTAFMLVLLMNRLTIYLSFAAVVLAASYPFMKRYTHLPQFYLGMAFGWAIPMAFAAQGNSIPPVAWVLFAANVFWVVAYDTAYAMVDRDDDIKIGVKSTAILFGRYDRFMIGLCHALCLVLLVLVGQLMKLDMIFYVSLIVAAGIAGYQQLLISRRDKKKCFQAFLNNNWFGLVVFLGFVLSFLPGAK
ncbi:MAG TPA: 4-hydroxybenzoate octaprenyltransferase [Acidiferrobacteraceae bacterium]|nr:4-hydroxybenzoate octaprenyltransferase [Acidiferrobacteraceae bacterium]HEX19694.1 4-hydroxybenzoate octaprenyltransferase [Acidiferrobacteraceae bacterium]